QALARLDHPDVVRVLHCGREGTTAFLAMELLHGQSLREWMQQGVVDFHAALSLCRQVADVMVDVHGRGIIHRDLKPENVFLCPDAATVPGQRVKLLDFGIAKLPPRSAGALDTTQVHTHESTFIGTYAYMAPEQLRSAATVEGPADVYSLGVMLFELLAGRTPFDATEPIEAITAHALKEPPALRQCTPTVPGALSAFVATMLAKEPGARPSMARCRDMLGRSWAPEGDVCPVPGLASFTESQSTLFFGRGPETDALLGLLEEARTGARRWVQVEGPSGVGKSSLVHAGLLPRLKELAQDEGPRWLIAPLRPSGSPLRGMAQALAAVYAPADDGTLVEAILRTLRTGPNGLRECVVERTLPGCLLLLVIEPLEELFTLDAEERRAFDALLSTALSGVAVPLRLLTAVRSDFLHRLEQQLPALVRSLPEAVRYPLPPMGESGLGQVVHGLSRHAGLQLAEGLASRMVNDARNEEGRLPLLGHALRGLWGLHEAGPLTHTDYDRLGGVGGALARQAEGLLDALGPEGRERAKWLLLDLVQVGRGVPDTRRPRSRQEVLEAAGGDRLAEEVLQRLTGTRLGMEPGPRLVTLSGDAVSGQRVDLAHEALLQQVPSLVGWLDRERALLERHADLEAAASAWAQAKHPEEGLPTGALRLHYQGGTDASAERGLRERRLSPLVTRFLEAARRLERRRARVRQGLVAVAILAVLAILFSAARSERERKHAEENLRKLVVTADALVSNADWKLSRLPFTLPTRRNLLEGSEQALAELPESELAQPEVRLTRIKVLHRRGDLAYFDDRLSDAEAYLGSARRDIDAGLARTPHDGGLLLQLGLNHSKLGKVVWARGRWQEARKFFQDSLVLLKPSENESDSVDSRRSEAVSLAEMAELELANQQLGTAVELYGRAIALHASNVEATNGANYNKAMLALTLAARAEGARKGRDFSRSQEDLERALHLGRDIIHDHEGEQFYHWVLARVLVELAALEAAQGRVQDAERHYAEAEKMGRVLREGEMPNKRFALVLVQALMGREALAHDAGQAERERGFHAARCSLVKEFSSRDPDDIRFKSSGCEAAWGIQE
ncbi:MAG: serine/threonine-protein kinase PknK, partial [Myxococcaceae bacterium]